MAMLAGSASSSLQSLCSASSISSSSRPHGAQLLPSRCHAAAARASIRLSRVVVVCSSSSKGAPGRGKPKPTGIISSSASMSSTATAATAAVVTAPTAAATAAGASSAAAASGVITIQNPPLGFANNIVPAGPLVTSQPSSHSPLVESSDEELDDSSSLVTSSTDESPGSPAGGTGRSAPYRCLVLDSRYLPVNVVNWFRAVVMDESGKVDVLEYHPGGFAYSAYKAHPLPAVLRVRTFVDVHEFAGRLSLTRKNVLLRDHHRCQYCGASKDLTLDHVVPVCRGGVNSWSNLVTACMSCNQRKGDKSLQQLGWKLPRQPREPSPHEVGVIAGLNRGDLDQPPLPWVPYLDTFKQVLEKAQRRAAAAAAAQGNWSGGSSGSSTSAAESFIAEQQDLLFSRSSSSSSSKRQTGGAGAAAVGGSKGSKAAAAVAAAALGGGVKAAAVTHAAGASGKGKKGKGISANAKRIRG